MKTQKNMIDILFITEGTTEIIDGKGKAGLEDFIARKLLEKIDFNSLIGDIQFRIDRIVNTNLSLDNPDFFRNYDIIYLSHYSMPYVHGEDILTFISDNNLIIPVLYDSANSIENWKSFQILREKLRFTERINFLRKKEDFFYKVVEVCAKYPVVKITSRILVSNFFDTNSLRYFQTNAEELYKLPPRKFEELISHLLYISGWEVELTPYSADGGIDIIAVQSLGVARHKMLVQVKRYSKDKKVGVEVARELMYLVGRDNANSGLIATTSFFTKGIIKEASLFPWKLNLHDFNQIAEWINKAI